MPDDEVTTERVAEWLVNQCLNEDGWQIDVKIEVIPATDPCPMTDADREMLRAQTTVTLQAVARQLKLRTWCDEEKDAAPPTPPEPGAGPWTLTETFPTTGV